MKSLPSRNRWFDLYQIPRFLRARRTQKLLETIQRDLRRPDLRATLRIRRVRLGRWQRYRLDYDNPLLHLSRTSYLTPREFDRFRSLLASADGRLRVHED
jgi:hypothetical protein